MLSFLFVMPLILLPVFAEQIPDYDKPYSPIFFDKPVYSWTDKIKITILAPSWNTDRNLIDSIGDNQFNPIKISTAEKSLEPYRFTETGPNTGIFKAEVTLTGFPYDVDGDGKFDTSPRTLGNGPTSGFLETERDSAITVSFEFADGVVLTESVPIQWNIGNAQFSETNYGSDESAILRIIDPDLNLNPEAMDQIQVDVSSDSDVAGIQVNAIETSESSGVFIATISFTQNLSSSGNRLLALPGDEIYAKYTDFTLPKPYTKSDNLEIITTAKLNSSLPALSRVSSLPINLADNFGNSLQNFSVNNRIQIVGSIINEQNYNQEFVYLIQVKNQNNAVVSLSWVSGELSPNQNLDVSQSWLPKNSGDFVIETFVWNSLSEQIPLSNFTSSSITIS